MNFLLRTYTMPLTDQELAGVAGGIGVRAGGVVVTPSGIVRGGAAVIDGVAVAYGSIDQAVYAGFGIWGRQHVSGYSVAG